MAININSELNDICRDFENLYKDIIRQMGLVSKENKPHMVDSIKFTYISNGSGYKFQMVAFDYYKFLAKQFHIQSNVSRDPRWKQILKRVAVLNARVLKEQIIKELNTK